MTLGLSAHEIEIVLASLSHSKLRAINDADIPLSVRQVHLDLLDGIAAKLRAAKWGMIDNDRLNNVSSREIEPLA